MREAPTIVLIGAGSTSFGLTTLHDLYADPVFTGATIRLVDLEPAPLERMAQLAAALEAATGRGVTAERHTDRVDALPGADAVVVSVEVDRVNRWLLDFEIPRRHGIDHIYGENGGPGGLSHAHSKRRRSGGSRCARRPIAPTRFPARTRSSCP